MYIDEKEAERRLKDSGNLLNILQKGSCSTPVPELEEVVEEEDSSSNGSNSAEQKEVDSPNELGSGESNSSDSSSSEVDPTQTQSSSPLNSKNDEYADIVVGVMNTDGRGSLGSSDSRKGNRTNHANSGRKLGSLAVPDSLKLIAGIAAHTKTVKEVAEELGISRSQVQSYKHGKTTSGGEDKVDPDLSKQVRSGVQEVHDLAVSKVKHMLGLITDEELNQISTTKEKVKVVEGLANVVNKTAPRVIEKPEATGPTFIFVAPSMPNPEAVYGKPVDIYVDEATT